MYSTVLGNTKNRSFGAFVPGVVGCHSLAALISVTEKLKSVKDERYDMLVDSYNSYMHKRSKRKKK